MESMKDVITNMMQQEEQHCNSGELKDEYCDKCHTRKSVVIELFGKKRKMPCLCKCEGDKLKEQQQIEEQQKGIKCGRMN